MIDAATGRPLNATASISCDPTGKLYGGLQQGLAMGRFELRGLAAGELRRDLVLKLRRQ